MAITILDINDNAPEFATDYETTVCENAQPGQVSASLRHAAPRGPLLRGDGSGGTGRAALEMLPASSPNQRVSAKLTL